MSATFGIRRTLKTKTNLGVGKEVLDLLLALLDHLGALEILLAVIDSASLRERDVELLGRLGSEVLLVGLSVVVLLFDASGRLGALGRSGGALGSLLLSVLLALDLGLELLLAVVGAPALLLGLGRVAVSDSVSRASCSNNQRVHARVAGLRVPVKDTGSTLLAAGAVTALVRAGV